MEEFTEATQTEWTVDAEEKLDGYDLVESVGKVCAGAECHRELVHDGGDETKIMFGGYIGGWHHIARAWVQIIDYQKRSWSEAHGEDHSVEHLHHVEHSQTGIELFLARFGLIASIR